jgi:hypothetical protein
MALATSLAVLLAVVLFAITATALGHRLLRLWPAGIVPDVEHLLFSAAFGVIGIEMMLFLVQFWSHIRLGVGIVFGIALILGVSEFAPVLNRVYRVLRKAGGSSRFGKYLIGFAGLILLVEGLAAMAPVTGSDALHYHFTAPLLELQSGFHPDFFLSHSFFTGQSHLLILAGLALGSSQFAMGLLYLGGVLAAAAAASLSRRWTDPRWAWTTALVFLVNPVVFWQISSAGAPDLWMAFFTTAGVLFISQSVELPPLSHALLSGALAGAVAGTKYTGCIVAASMALAYLWQARSALKVFLFFLGSVCAGIWPYARNLAWTGDPMFPFLTRWLFPERVNAYSLASYLADTGAGGHRSVWQVLEFLFFAGVDPLHPGFWQFLGPLVLAFAPLLVLVVRNNSTWRAVLPVWILSAIGIGATSGMTRFLLPVLPVALAAVLAGAAQLQSIGWRSARYISLASLCGFLMLGASGLLVYDRSAISVAVGLTSREEYLLQHAPEYEKVRFVDKALAGDENGDKALVFIRHLYYLRVPFLYGDPAASWAVDPSKLQAPEDWEALFHKEGIRWVVRSPEYPPMIAAPLEELEKRGKLLPMAQMDVSDFQGLRIAGERQVVPVVILQVKE